MFAVRVAVHPGLYEKRIVNRISSEKTALAQFSGKKVAVTVPFPGYFILMEDAWAHDILVLLQVTTPKPAGTIRPDEFLAVPDKTA